MDFAAVNSAALSRSRELVPEWLPGGRFVGHEYVCGGTQGGKGRSLSVNLLTGQWGDFAADLKGGDLVSLYAQLFASGSQGDACRQLEALLGVSPQRVNGHYTNPDPVQMQELPSDRPLKSAFRHREHGDPEQFWIYRDKDGRPMGVVARYDPAGRPKQYTPWIFTGIEYRPKAFTRPRMLYGLETLDRPGRVHLLEGEKAVDAARHWFPTKASLTWPGGAGGVSAANWAPLQNREVTIWPDNDAPGMKAAAEIAGKLLSLGCKVFRIDVSAQPEKWDLADYVGTRENLLSFAKANSHEIALLPPDPAPPVIVDVPRGTTEHTVPLADVTSDAKRPPPTLWSEWGLAMRGNSKPYLDADNVRRCIVKIGDMDIHYDTFALKVMTGTQEFGDEKIAQFQLYLQSTVGLREISQSIVRQGVYAHAYEHQRNPPREWLESLAWDGVYRLSDLCSLGFGATPSTYMQSVSKNFMTGMVARIFSPGCKADCMPIFEGAQGAGKSRALALIGGAYFSEVHESMSTKDFYLACNGKFLLELGELNSMHGQSSKHIKGILSTSTDRYRTPYGRVASDNPRQFVFAGTTNETDWNVDETGARRFWPVRCGTLDLTWIENNRTQLFAEAVARYRQGMDWWRIPEEQAKFERDARREFDMWQEVIEEYCLGRNSVTINAVAINALNMDNILAGSSREARRIAKTLSWLGYESRTWRDPDRSGKVIRHWIKIDK